MTAMRQPRFRRSLAKLRQDAAEAKVRADAANAAAAEARAELVAAAQALHVEGEQSYREIADVLKMSHVAVMKMLQKATAKGLTAEP